jgi:hypothetical protein
LGNDRKGRHSGFGRIQPRFQHGQLIGIDAVLRTVVGALQLIHSGLLQGEIILRFDDPILWSWTLEILDLVFVLIAPPGLNQQHLCVGLRHPLCGLQIVQVILCLLVVFFCILQVNDDLSQIRAGRVHQFVQGLLCADQFKLCRGIVRIRFVAQTDEWLSCLHRLPFFYQDFANHTAGAEGNLSIVDGFNPSLGYDGIVRNDCWDYFRRCC